MIDARQKGELPDDQFIDVQTADLMTDPATTIAEIYSRLGWDYPKEVREAIRTNIENKPRGSRGRHRYALEDFGLDGASERKRFAFYQERFGVADEA